MSEDFDKEAEREELRRKLEREEEAREATEHMSDLLLKGATMTNKHCGECGDPVFRYQGQEFCPTCGNELGPVDAPGEDADAAGEAPPGREAGAVDTDESATATTPGNGGEAPSETPGELDVEVPSSGGRERPQDAGADAASPSMAGEGSRGGEPPTQSRMAAANAGDLGEARASLVRTLTRLAREAESAEDVRRARDLLAAAREAAEAIAAVDSAGR